MPIARARDRVAAVLLLTALAPVLLAIAALIRLDTPGPILSRGERAGADGGPTLAWRFRTTHAPSRPATIWAWRGADRVTRVGRTLRALDLDELPQLLMVARGDLSLMGLVRMCRGPD